MSRIGRLPINIPSGVTVNVSDNNIVTVKGPLGELNQKVNKDIKVQIENNTVLVSRLDDKKLSRSLHGLYRNLIANHINGVIKKYEKRLVLNGVGYKAIKEGNVLVLSIGYSHKIKYQAPEGIDIEVPTPTEIIVKGIDKEKVGQSAANIRNFRIPDPYHLYGIRYKDEEIMRKEGKKSGK